MNWKDGNAVNAQIAWAQHIAKEKSYRVDKEHYTVNPHTYRQYTVAPTVSTRPARFLNRDAAQLQAANRILQANGHPGIDLESMAPADSTLPPIRPQVEGEHVWGPRLKGRKLNREAFAYATGLVDINSPGGKAAEGKTSCVRDDGDSAVTRRSRLQESLAGIQKGPLDKYTHPLTANQEIGWYHKPLVPTYARSQFPKNHCEITKQASVKSPFRQGK